MGLENIFHSLDTITILSSSEDHEGLNRESFSM